jgi:iron complex outermembrane receptor protein
VDRGDLQPGTQSATNENFSTNRFREAALTLNYPLPGGTELTSVSAFSRYRLNEGCDCDFVAAPLITAGISEDYNQYSEELRFTSPAEARLQWIGGLYVQKYTLDESDFLHLPTAAEEGDLPVPMGSIVPTLIASNPASVGAVAGALTQAGHPACAGGPATGTCQQAAAAYIQGLFTGASNPRDFSQDSMMYSVFLQGTWKFNDKWRGSLGARVNHEKKDGSRHAWLTSVTGSTIPAYDPANPATYLPNILFNSVLGIVQHDISGSRKETSVSPLLNLQYRPNERSMGYASISRGYKSGGFDARSNKPTVMPPGLTGAPGTFEFKDERATTYEVGLKTEAASGRADANIDFFYTDYKNLQTSAFDGRIGFNVGNGSAEVRGVEFEGRWRPIRSLLLKASMAALDFKWKKYNGQCYYDLSVATGGLGNAVDDQGNPIPGNCDYSGKDNQFAPHFTGVLSAEHTMHLGALALVTTLDVVHSSSYLESLNLDPMLRQKAFTKLNARIGLGDDYDHWQVALVGKNLTDKTTVAFAADAPLAQALFKARSYYGFVDPPRSIAVELRVRL